jgi:hypothetical protein
MSKKRFEELVKYVQSNGRVCPQPIQWDKLWKMLPGRKRVDNGWNPPVPLILGGWWDSSDTSKRARLLEHIQYAADNGALDKVDKFLRMLPEDQWHHEGE